MVRLFFYGLFIALSASAITTFFVNLHADQLAAQRRATTEEDQSILIRMLFAERLENLGLKAQLMQPRPSVKATPEVDKET